MNGLKFRGLELYGQNGNGWPASISKHQIWGDPPWGYPNSWVIYNGQSMTIPLKWMIYVKVPSFWKPPRGVKIGHGMTWTQLGSSGHGLRGSCWILKATPQGLPHNSFVSFGWIPKCLGSLSMGSPKDWMIGGCCRARNFQPSRVEGLCPPQCGRWALMWKVMLDSGQLCRNLKTWCNGIILKHHKLLLS